MASPFGGDLVDVSEVDVAVLVDYFRERVWAGAELSGFGVAPSARGAVPPASVVDEEPASGGGDVVGVGVVDFDVVDGLDGVGRLDGVEVDGLSGVVAEGVFCGELAGGGEAFALDVWLT